MPKRYRGPWVPPRTAHGDEAQPRPLPTRGTRPTRAELLAQLAEAKAAGDRGRVSGLLGRLMLTPHDARPPGGTSNNGRP